MRVKCSTTIPVIVFKVVSFVYVLTFIQKTQQLRQTESTLHRRQAEHTAILVAKDTAQQHADEAEAKVCITVFVIVCRQPSD